jgi:hypothetical protein
MMQVPDAGIQSSESLRAILGGPIKIPVRQGNWSER